MQQQQSTNQDNDLEQQWSSMSSGFEESSNGFLSAATQVEVERTFDWLRPFDEALIPLGDYVIALLTWVVVNRPGIVGDSFF